MFPILQRSKFYKNNKIIKRGNENTLKISNIEDNIIINMSRSTKIDLSSI